MNKVFVSGTIINDIQYNFILNNKDIAISKFRLKIKEDIIITIIAKNEKADYCYKNLKKGKIIYIIGKITTNGEIEINEILYT